MDVNTMSAEQVRFELAILRGADQSILVEIDAATGKQRTIKHEASSVRGIPDWPNDAGAALALCLYIAREQGMHGVNVLLCGDGFIAHMPPDTSMFTREADTPALALSRLALLALREEGGRHE